MVTKLVSAEKKAKLKEGLESGKSVTELSRELGLSRNYIYGFRRRNDPKHTISIGATNTVLKNSLNEIANLKSEIAKRDKIILQFALNHFGNNL